MSHKLVFIVPSAAVAVDAVTSLRSMGLTDDELSLVGDKTVELDSLPDAGEFENDVIPGVMRGAGFGGATGLLAGLGAAALAGPGIVVGGAALALATAGGATFGVLASAIMGSSLPDSRLEEYEGALERGDLLLIAEVEEDKVDETTAALTAAHPEVTFAGDIDLLPPVI